MARILIVDDSMTDVHAIKTVLEGGGHEVVVADSAAVGLETARQRQPDLILMDVVFEGMSGFQGTRKLARDPDTAHIPIVIISRKDQESDVIWGKRQGALEYLVKPVKPKKLLDSVASALQTGRAARVR